MRTRNRRIHIYLTDDELLKLDRKVDSCNMSREQYLRMLISGFAPREAPPIEYKQLIRELRKVGANINQILFVANTKGFIDTPMLRKAIQDCWQTEVIVRDAFKVGELQWQ